ncbi:hypothetical protein BD410DRAFT_454421 [Rickenella mellea]|uniref:RING-type domain-containing protein n=1 Tax=Rickenella mellea TaxID=50990 RepID=A0A4Y7PVF7_9AGAM|nr:hypothetical protein BD410DRAFT_454421 [Rickenella mellea]
MLTITSNSSCDVCVENYGPLNLPSSIPCHVLCNTCSATTCEKASPRHLPLCPFCQEPFTADSIRVIRVDYSKHENIPTSPRSNPPHELPDEVRVLKDKVAKVASKKCSIDELNNLQKELQDWLTTKGNENSEAQPASLLLSAALLRAILGNYHASLEVITKANGLITDLRSQLHEGEKREKELKKQLHEEERLRREERARHEQRKTRLTEITEIDPPRGRSTRVKSISPPSSPRRLSSRGRTQSTSTGQYPARNSSSGPTSRHFSPTRSTLWSPSEDSTSRPIVTGVSSPSNHSGRSYSADRFTLVQHGTGHHIRRPTSRSSNPPISPLVSTTDDTAASGGKDLRRCSSSSSHLAMADSKGNSKKRSAMSWFRVQSKPIGSQKPAVHSSSASQSEAAGRSNERNDHEREGR